MTFHEFERGMSVMDGRRCVAAARKWGCGLWMLTLYSGSWIDAMTDSDRQAHLVRMGGGVRPMRPNYSAHLKVCRTKAEARRWMRGLADD